MREVVGSAERGCFPYREWATVVLTPLILGAPCGKLRQAEGNICCKPGSKTLQPMSPNVKGRAEGGSDF